MNTAVALYNESLACLPEKGARPGDDVRAFTLNARAAALGHYDAILAAGWFYLNGRGVTPDLKLAEYWYRKAARRGEPRAMFSLGYIAYEALAFAIARRWFERAGSAGHVRSFYWLGKLAWRGHHGSSRDPAAAFALFHRAARAHDPEAVRALRFLSRSRRMSNQDRAEANGGTVSTTGRQLESCSLPESPADKSIGS